MGLNNIEEAGGYLQFLRENERDYVQGYIYSPPISAAEILNWRSTVPPAH
jgi:EAL domain-containing protein (putative c-di-GMP-specific phosphodiesterase class I)